MIKFFVFDLNIYTHFTHLQNLLISQFSADTKLSEIRFQEHNKLHIIVNSTHDFQDFAAESNTIILPSSQRKLLIVQAKK